MGEIVDRFTRAIELIIILDSEVLVITTWTLMISVISAFF
jgi:ABC-type tungstate transport system substrate-binding protein